MNLSGPFIRRPVMTTLLSLSALFFGAVAYFRLPVSELPNVDFPTILVTASVPGASPETMASSVATPLERQFSTISGISSMTSSSTLSSTSVVLQFDLDKDLDAAAQDVQAAIARAAPFLPPEMPTPPTYRKLNPAEQPILYIAFQSDSMPLYRLDDYAETQVAQRLSQVSGVAQVQVFGAQKYAVRVQADPSALASRGIGLDELAQAIQSANVNLPTGILEGPDQALTIDVRGQLLDAAAYRGIIVAYRGGNPVRLDEVAQVVDSVENDRTAAWFNGKPALVLAIQRQPGTNTVKVAGAVRSLLPQLLETLPASVRMNVVYDRSVTIQASVRDVQITLVITLVLVVLVIFVFLRIPSATLIPSLALPMSIVGTFAVMYLFGFSLDNLSLLALVLSVGFITDDAIVVLENIVRHREMDETRRAAALSGSAEIGFTIISMTISLVAVFIPVLFLGGIVGRLFYEFAVVIAVAILISGVVSLTLTPMLASRFLRAHEEREGRFYRVTERAWEWMVGIYGRTLRPVLRHRLPSLIVVVLMLVVSVLLFRALPKGFLPTEDTGTIFVSTEAAQGISWNSMRQHQLELVKVARADPAVDTVVATAGVGGGLTGANAGIMFIRLKPRGERAGVETVMARIRRAFDGVPGIRAYPQVPPSIAVGGQLTKSQYQFTLASTDTEALYSSAKKVEARIAALPGFRDVTSDLQLSDPQARIELERDRLAALGLSADAVEQALASAYASRQISTIYGTSNQYRVILELEPRYRTDPASLDELYLRSSSGELVPLDSVTETRKTVGPLAVNHAGQLTSVTISFNLDPSVSLGQAVSQVNRVAKQELPGSISTNFQGTAQAFQASLSNLNILLIMAILVIYLVLGILYESFIHPVTILSALPFAGFGALLALLVTGTELSLYAFVGIIMLVGLVKKNGIMMVDFAIEAETHRDMAPRDAIYDACLTRFRPITMTTMSALFGTLPIAFAVGTGAESRRPLGIAVVGGLLFSQLFTLYVTPVFYLYMDSAQRFLRRHMPKGKRRKPDAAAEEPGGP